MNEYEMAVDYATKTSVECHMAAVEAGWWTDPVSGDSLIGKRDFIAMCALITTEITEAYDGFKQGAMDDKLPHRLQLEVELGDAFIRMGDTSHGCGVNLAAGFAANENVVPFAFGSPLIVMLFETINYVSYAVEGQRKRDFAKRDINMARAMLGIMLIGGTQGLDVRGAIAEKMAFNKVRPDHKLENRMKEGGKKE